MSTITEPPNTTHRAIYARYERCAATEPPRAHLGASVIGKPCLRELWYQFRWASSSAFDGRMLRLFTTGTLEEHRVIYELKNIGCEVFEKDPETNEQWNFLDCGGHFGGSCDAIIASGLPEAPKSPHLLEVKTSNDAGFKELSKNGIEKAKPVHFAQCQTYLHWTHERWGSNGIDRALYLVVNKNTDEIHTERVHRDPEAGKRMVEKAAIVIKAKEPLSQIDTDPESFNCKWCNHRPVCHGNAIPQANCRTCAHATPVTDDEFNRGLWICELHGEYRSTQQQAEGCSDHVYIPALLQFAEPIDGDDTWVLYRRKDNGRPFINAGPNAELPKDFGPPCRYTSKELAACPPSMVADPEVDRLKKETGATVVKVERKEAA